MFYDPQRYHRRSVRLKGYDYSSPGAYYVTICAAQRGLLFGRGVQGTIELNEIGQVIHDVWLSLPHHYPHITLDAFVVMPDHVHGTIVIVDAPAPPPHGAIHDVGGGDDGNDGNDGNDRNDVGTQLRPYAPHTTIPPAPRATAPAPRPPATTTIAVGPAAVTIAVGPSTTIVIRREYHRLRRDHCRPLFGRSNHPPPVMSISCAIRRAPFSGRNGITIIKRLYGRFGFDVGADIPVVTEWTRNLRPPLRACGADPRFRLILFALDESAYGCELTPLAARYPAVPLGLPRWFFGSVNGMSRYFAEMIEIAGVHNQRT